MNNDIKWNVLTIIITTVVIIFGIINKAEYYNIAFGVVIILSQIEILALKENVRILKGWVSKKW